MKKLIMLLSTAAVLTSCSKKNSDIASGNGNEPAVVVDLIKTSTFDVGVETFTYDNKGRALEASYPNGKKRVYEYEPGKITAKYYGAGSNFLYSYTHELNANGIAIRITESTKPGYEELREYNADGTHKKSIYKDGASVNSREYFYSNGNCDSSRFYLDGVFAGTIKYMFYTDKSNGLSNAQFGKNFYGKPNKNLLKSITYVNEDGTISSLINSEYEFDAKGRVIKLTETLVGGTPEIGTYTYMN